ncbi:MAG: ABC transporter permease subunit [Planctomycetota bacterium]
MTRITVVPTSPLKQSFLIDLAFHWLRSNIFSGVINSLLSLALIALIVTVLSNFIVWAVLNAVWNAGSFDECKEIIAATHGSEAHGACWAVLKGRVGVLLFGFYPPELYWRPITALVLLFAALAPVFFKSLPRSMLGFSAVYPVIAYQLIRGGFVLEVVETREFGGLMLTLILAVSGIALSIPTGIALALGRQFLIRPCRAFFASIIAFVRGVPLIVLLFAAFLLTNLFVPPGTHIDSILRAVAVIALHTGARIAGAIHEGLVAIPQGQWDAASALGLGQRKAIWLIALPQVLRSLSPWIVLAAVGAFRDTTLVAIAGFFDPVALLVVIRNDIAWHGVLWEVFIFVGAIYWSICFCMTCYSKYLERKLEAERSQSINLNQQLGTGAIATDSTA